jgi:hypothetical protein
MSPKPSYFVSIANLFLFCSMLSDSTYIFFEALHHYTFAEIDKCPITQLLFVSIPRIFFSFCLYFPMIVVVYY